MEAINKGFGRRLRELRESAGLSQSELSERSGMNVKFLGSIERERGNVTLISVEKLRQGLGVKLHELFRFDPKEPMSEERVDQAIFGHLLSRFDRDLRSRVFGLVKDIHRLTHQKQR